MNKMLKKWTARERNLNKSAWFMRIACVSLVVLLLVSIIVCEITAVSWLLLGIAVTFLVLGLIFGISYLDTPVGIQKRKGDTNG